MSGLSKSICICVSPLLEVGDILKFRALDPSPQTLLSISRAGFDNRPTSNTPSLRFTEDLYGILFHSKLVLEDIRVQKRGKGLPKVLVFFHFHNGLAFLAALWQDIRP